MSKLDMLIRSLCPNGVPYVALGTIAKAEKERNKGQKHNLAFSITKDGLVKTSDYFKEATVTSEDTSGYKIVKKNWFVYSPSRIDVGSINYLKDEELVIVSPLNVVFSVSEDSILPQYLLYFLQSRFGTWQIMIKREGIEGTGRKLLPFERFSTIELPLPPLDIQHEIVRILGRFEALTAKLTTELTARKKQYEHYRDKLLSFDTSINHVRLGDICSVITKGTTPKYYTESGISFVKTEAFNGTKIVPEKLSYVDEETHTTFLRRSILEENDILITIAGATIGKCVLVPKEILPANTNQALAIIRLAEGNSPKYVMHVLQSDLMKQYMQKNIKGSAQPNLSLKQLNDFVIPLPSLHIQEYLVQVLDSFDAICSDINIGLPAEIEARQKQYEYYRDKLLSFKEVGKC